MRKIKEILINIYYRYFHISTTKDDFTTHYYDEGKFNDFLEEFNKIMSSKFSSR